MNAKYLAMVLLIAGSIGLLASQTLFQHSFSYAFYAGPKITITSEDEELSAVTSPASAEDWRSHIYTEDSDIFQPGYASYNLTKSGACEIHIHDYVVEAYPASITERVDVGYTTMSRFCLVYGGEETIIDTFYKARHEPESEPSREIQIDLTDLEKENSLSYPYEISSRTVIDYDARNTLSKNTCSYELEDFRLVIGESYVSVERFSEVPYIKLVGVEIGGNDIRDLGIITLILGAVSALIHLARDRKS